MVFNGFVSIYCFLMYEERIPLPSLPPAAGGGVRNTSLTFPGFAERLALCYRNAL